MDSYRVARVTAPGGTFEIAEREVPQPGPGHVRIAVEACGVCHSDAHCVEGRLPAVSFPDVLGHETAGRIEEPGEGVHEQGWQVDDRVAVGSLGGTCGHCTRSRQGDFAVCENLKAPGCTYDGGFGDTTVAPVDALLGVGALGHLGVQYADTLGFETGAAGFRMVLIPS